MTASRARTGETDGALARPVRPAVLGVAAFVVYASIGLAFHLEAPRLFHYLDQVFDADIPSRIFDLTRPQGPHERSHFHPLFVLLLNPLGWALRGVLRSFGVEAAGRVAAIALTAAAGGLGVGLMASLLHRAGVAPRRAALGAGVFALSASQLVFASFPETFAFSAASLLLVYWLGARPRGPTFAPVLAGVVSFGMTITNIGAVLLVRADGRPRLRLDWLRPLVLHALAVVGLAAALSLVQAWLYPGTPPFFVIERVERDDRRSFVSPTSAAAARDRAREVAFALLVSDLAAPRIVVHETGTPLTQVDLPDASAAALRPLGWVHLLLWTGLLATALLGTVRGRLWNDPLPVTLALWLLGQCALHSVFGESLFLYSGHWTFAVVALTVLAAERAVLRPLHEHLVTALLTGLVVLQAVVNGSLLAELMAVFSVLR